MNRSIDYLPTARHLVRHLAVLENQNAKFQKGDFIRARMHMNDTPKTELFELIGLFEVRDATEDTYDGDITRLSLVPGTFLYRQDYLNGKPAARQDVGPIENEPMFVLLNPESLDSLTTRKTQHA